MIVFLTLVDNKNNQEKSEAAESRVESKVLNQKIKAKEEAKIDKTKKPNPNEILPKETPPVKQPNEIDNISVQ